MVIYFEIGCFSKKAGYNIEQILSIDIDKIIGTEHILMRKLKENFERKPHYGIRKLTIGVASVVIGLSFLGYTSDVVKADSENTAETNQTAKDPESEAETASSDNDTQEDAKKASEISPVEKKEETSKPTDSVARDKDKTTAPEKTENTLPVVTGTDNQNQITSAQELSESKDATSDNQKSELGKSPVNVDDWKYNTDTNQDINLTDYIGNDKVNIVIPNDQDFIKAGKLNEGHAVKISSKTMHNLIVKDKPTSVIISKTNKW